MGSLHGSGHYLLGEVHPASTGSCVWDGRARWRNWVDASSRDRTTNRSATCARRAHEVSGTLLGRPETLVGLIATMAGMAGGTTLVVAAAFVLVARLPRTLVHYW